MRVWPALALVVALTAGCGQSPAAHVARGPVASPSASPESQPPPQLHLSFNELRDALPLAAELYPWKVTMRCLSVKAKCGHWHHGGRGAVLFGTGSRDHGISETLLVAAMRWPTPAAARRAADRMRAVEARRYTGRFQRSPEGTTTRYTAGEAGRGDLADLAMDGWSGFRRSSQFRYLLLPPGRHTRTASWVSVVLVRDHYTLHVQATRWPPEQAGQTVEEQLTRLIGALEQPGPAVSGP
jgi:hypothetical protein